MAEQLPHFIKQYINHLEHLGRQPSTIKRYLYDLADFSLWLQSKRKTTASVNWATITVNELEQFFHDLLVIRQYNIRTVRRIHSVLRQVARFQHSIGSSELKEMYKIEPPPLLEDPLSPSEWLNEKELNQLMNSLASDHHLSDQQIETFPFYKERNLFIVSLFAHYGLTIQEAQSLSMANISFIHNEIRITDEEKKERVVKLQQKDKLLAYTYFTAIPEPVRPRHHTNDPFFVAFDFKRKTFHWSYEDDMPKRMTIIAMQKMIRTEVRRANLRKGISAQTLRHTYILKELLSSANSAHLIEQIGYTSPLSLKRYEATVSIMTEDQKNALLGR